MKNVLVPISEPKGPNSPINFEYLDTQLISARKKSEALAKLFIVDETGSDPSLISARRHFFKTLTKSGDIIKSAHPPPGHLTRKGCLEISFPLPNAGAVFSPKFVLDKTSTLWQIHLPMGRPPG